MKLCLIISPGAAERLAGTLPNLKSSSRLLGISLSLKTLASPDRLPARYPAESFLLAVEKELKSLPGGNHCTLFVLSSGGFTKKIPGVSASFPYPDRKNSSLWAFGLLSFCQTYLLKKNYKETLREIGAFEINSEFSRNELMDLRSLLKAQESVIELGRQEKIRYEQELSARQKTAELGRQELISSREIIQAWESFYVMVREELLELRKDFDAQQKTLELSGEERKDSDKTLKAMDSVAELSRQETLNGIESVQNLTEQEISSILDKEGLWDSLLGKTDKVQLIEVIKGLFRLLLRKSRRTPPE